LTILDSGLLFWVTKTVATANLPEIDLINVTFSSVPVHVMPVISQNER